jgi:hypothetical protein
MQVFLTCKGSLHALGLGDLPGSATRGLAGPAQRPPIQLPVCRQNDR